MSEMQNQTATTQVASNAGANANTQKFSTISGFLPIILVFAVFYLMIIRPQSKKAKQEQKMRESVKVGNKVVLTSGIFGTIKEINDEKSVISFEVDKNVTIVVYKSSIAQVLQKDEQKNEKSGDKK